MGPAASEPNPNHPASPRSGRSAGLSRPGSSAPPQPGAGAEAAPAAGAGDLRSRLFRFAALACGMPSVGLAVACVLLWPTFVDRGYAAPFVIAGGVCLVALLLQAFALTALLQRLRSLSLVGQALDQWARDEPDLESLIITGQADGVSQHWNALIQQQQAHHTADLEARLESGDRPADDATPRHDATLNALPHGVIMVGAGRRIVSANGAACRLLCRSMDRIIDAPVDKIVDDQNLLAVLDRVLTGRDSRGATVELTFEADADHSAIVRATVRPLDASGQTALVVFEDVTQQRTADRSRNLFVAQATHELRTPLTNIALYLERAIDLDDDETADRAECLNVINSEVLRLGRVVEEVLSVSQIEAGSMKMGRDDVRIKDLVQQLEDEYGPQARSKDVSLGFDLPPKMPVIQGDRDKINLALHNLLGNAIKYTPAGGSVRVQLDTDEQGLAVAISDTGIGIAESDLAKVFDKFYRADDDRLRDITGTGLGLALAREVIRLHGGDITVQSTLNQGSTFTLRLPLRDTADAAA